MPKGTKFNSCYFCSEQIQMRSVASALSSLAFTQRQRRPNPLPGVARAPPSPANPQYWK